MNIFLFFTNKLNLSIVALLQSGDMFMIIGTFIFSFIVVAIIIPIFISLAIKYKITDKPNQRKVHDNPIPTLGGVAIFIGSIVSFLLFIGIEIDINHVVLLAALTLLFATSIVDDLIELSALKRFLIQIISASLIFLVGFRFNSLLGLFGVYEVPLLVQYFLTIFWVVFIVNAINLIDGIDGLAGGLSLVASFVLSCFLFIKSDMIFALLGFALSGSILAFLKYNFNPAKIFMGDTGSVLIGFLISVLVMRVMNGVSHSNMIFSDSMMTKVSFSVILVPVYDAIRVSVLRIKNKKNPFSADQTHIHHLLLKTGFNHKRSAVILYISNILVIASAFLFSYLSTTVFVVFIICEAVFLTELLNLKHILNLNIKNKTLSIEFKMLEKQNYLVSKQLQKF
jgi:UDP-N-acetylmuramyl pentapeptide phosphotransferase/UDP-N-acetylglucosamine-1-phosphate transferase